MVALPVLHTKVFSVLSKETSLVSGAPPLNSTQQPQDRLHTGLWMGERAILLISSQHRGGRGTCLGAPGPAKLPLHSWPYFKSNSKMQLSKLLIPSPEKPRTALGAKPVLLIPGRVGEDFSGGSYGTQPQFPHLQGYDVRRQRYLMAVRPGHWPNHWDVLVHLRQGSSASGMCCSHP